MSPFFISSKFMIIVITIKATLRFFTLELIIIIIIGVKMLNNELVFENKKELIRPTGCTC